jgi:type I restriction enzyme S subunit
MRKYPKYKASGVEWVGDIPDNWEIWKLKHFGNVVLGKMLNNEEKPGNFLKKYLKASNVYWENISIDEIKEMYFSLHEIKRYRVKKGDLLVNEGGEVGRSAIWNDELEECYIQNSVHKITFKKDLSKFYLYLMTTYASKDFFNSIVNQVSISHLTYEKLIEIPFPRPSILEQLPIVRFLDHKTGQINRFITNRQNQIELLKEQKTAIINKAVTKGINPNAKMKDSGIEWIGEIPETWSISKVKFVAKVKGRIGFRGYTVSDLVEVGEGALTLGASHIDKEGGIDLSKPVYIRWDKYYESPEIMVEADDILVVQRGSIGVVGIVNSDIGYATINPSLVVLKKVRMNRYLLFLQLRSKIVKEAIITIFNETAVPMLSQNQISNFNILLPPTLEEQESIIDFIKTETSPIDTLISKYQKQIDLMQEYRTSLISQAVTGKIDVRDWQPKNNEYKTDQLPFQIAAEK